MEERLYEAAVAGDVTILDKLLQEDSRILDKAVLKCSDNNRTPLHIAAMLGHANFVKKNSEVCSDMCLACDRDGRNPLHIVASKGKGEVLEVFLQAGLSKICSDMCLARDRDGRNPLHLAAIKGKGEVLEVLLQAGLSLAARERTDDGGTILHLCVKYNQLEMLKTLVQVIKDSEFLNAKNDEGMTVLHLAVLGQQIETIRCLAETNIDVNTKNANGKTALDIARNLNSEMAIILEQFGALAGREVFDLGGKLFDQRRETIVIVATLIATLAFQAGINPPGGVWQEDSDPPGTINNNNATMAKRLHKAGEAVMAYNHPKHYKEFVTANTLAFLFSLFSIWINFTMLPFTHIFFMACSVVINYVTSACVVATYWISIRSITPHDNQNTLSQVVGPAILVYFGFIFLSVVAITLSVVEITTRGIRKWWKALEGEVLRSIIRERGAATGSSPVSVSIRR